MIVIERSALVAVLFEEQEGQAFEDIIAGPEVCVMSAVNVHETATVVRLRHGAAAVETMWRFIRDADIEIIPFDEPQVHAAVAAYGRYGKGIDPKARLNLADCAAYALAKVLDAPLLFKGNDFTHTDMKTCM